MKRCTSCALPDSVPGLSFDQDGVCFMCQSYAPAALFGEAAFKEFLAHGRPGPAGYDSLVPLSGGRDSSYVLYLAKAVYGLNPLAVNFDNEFRNPQAVMNMENACRTLGVDLRVVRSKADLAAKIVHSNTETAIPLGLAAMMVSLCRQCSYGYKSVAYREAERLGIPIILWGTSTAESTERIWENMGTGMLPSRWKRLRDLDFYKTEYLCLRQRLEFSVSGNPRVSRSGPRLVNPGVREISVFDYIPWERQRIKQVISQELGWEKPADHVSTWRTDCRLHEIVNFFFVKTIGCTKDCLGYCNMINAGQMTREEALWQEEQALARLSWERVSGLLEKEVGLSKEEIDRVNVLQSASPYPQR